MSERRWWIFTAAALVVCALTATATAQPQAPPRPGNALNWAFGGTVHTVARAGNVAFVGGRFNAVAARHNVVGGFAVISATTSHRALRTARVHGNVNAVIGDGAGGWFVGGNFTFVGAERRPQIVHLLADGRIDSAWTGRVDGRVLALALAGDTLYVGGEFAVAGSGVGGGMPAARQNLAAFAAADGALLPAVSSGADGVVLGLTAFGTTLYAGGEFATILGTPRAHVAAIDTTTGAVTGWNPGTDGAVRALLPAADGAIVYVGGLFANAGGAARANLAQLDATTGAATSFDPGANEAVLTLAIDGTALYAGGRFTTLGGSARNHAGAVHAATGVVQTWDPNADDAVLALTVAGGSVYLGGEFLNVGGLVRLHAARVAAATGTPEPWHPALNDPVRAMVVSGDQVAVGGSFEALGAYPRRNLAAIDLETGRLLPWNPRADGVVLALTLGRDRRLYVGGGFQTDGRPGPGAARGVRPADPRPGVVEPRSGCDGAGARHLHRRRRRDHRVCRRRVHPGRRRARPAVWRPSAARVVAWCPASHPASPTTPCSPSTSTPRTSTPAAASLRSAVPRWRISLAPIAPPAASTPPGRRRRAARCARLTARRTSSMRAARSRPSPARRGRTSRRCR